MVRKLTERDVWDRVEKTETCWLWRGKIQIWGYGRLTYRGQRWMVHRLVWTFVNGPIPEGLFVLHACDVPNCVRPDHLWLGTIADNDADRNRKWRHCYGERHHRAKLTDEKALAILREFAERRPDCPTLARQFGVSREIVWHLVSGHSWKHLPRPNAIQEAEREPARQGSLL